MKKTKRASKIIIQLMVFVLLFTSVDVTVFSKTNDQVVENTEKAEKSKASQDDKKSVKITKERNEELRTEIPSLRTETAKVYENPDGTLTSEIMLEPIHYKDGKEWKEIDNTVVPSSSGTEVENKQNNFKVKFPKNPVKKGYTQLFSYKVLNNEILFGIDQVGESAKEHTKPQNVQLNSSENQVSYKDLFKDVDFDYVVDGSKVKENIVLKSYQGKNTFDFHIKGKNISAKKRADGLIEFSESKTGKFLFVIQRPYMFDSSGEKGSEGALTHNVTQDITQVNDGYVLTVTADENYLKDPKRVFPVTIDPWIDVFDAKDTYVSDKNPTTNTSNETLIYVGNDAARGKTRSLLKWTLPTISNAVVTGGEIGLRQYSSYSDETVYAHKLLAPYVPTTVTWNTQPNYDKTPAQFRSNFEWGKYNYFPIDDMVKEWNANSSSNHGVMLKYSDATEGTSGRKAFHSQESVEHTETTFTKPKLVVYYRAKELLGITDYWEYTPDLFQGEGTAVVNVINGNMVYDIGLLSLPGKTSAFDLKMVYNSRSTYQDAYGYGWTFNAGRRLIPSLDKKIVEYIDEEGTRLHFGKQQHDSATSYTPPEGVFLELNSTSDGGYTIKETDESVLTFDSLGRNTKIVDEKGNTILYTYDGTSNRITKISERYGTETTGRDLVLTYNASGLLEKIVDFKGTATTILYNNLNGKSRLESITYASNRTEKKKITFTYNDASQLVGVEDANGNKGSVEYDVSNRVQKIIDPRSADIFAQLSYPSVTETIFTDAKNLKTYYKNSGIDNQTVNVIEKSEDYQGPTQATTQYEWKKNSIVKEVEPNKVTGAPDPSIANTATYDEKGNLTSSQSPNNLSTDSTYDSKSNITKDTENGTTYEYVYDSKSNLISTSDHYRVVDYNDYDKYGNDVMSVSGTRITHNRIQNSNFEGVATNGEAESWSRRSIGTYQVDGSTAKHGKKSAKITLSASDSAGYFTQTIPVQKDEPSKYYTVGANVKTSNLTGTGAQIRVYPLNASKQTMSDETGKTIIFTTSALKGTNDWTRISDFFQLPKDTAYIRMDLLVTGTGTAHFDSTQFLYGATLDNYYSNEYGSMEWDYDKSTDYSKLFALGTGDGLTTEMSRRGDSSFKLNGVSTIGRYFGQYVDVQGKKGDPLTVSGWSYGTDVNLTGEYELRLWFMYTDGTEEMVSLPFKKDILDQWQFVKQTFRATKDFNRVKVYGVFNKQNGAAFFDNIKVEENGSTTMDEYSPDGNFKVKSIDALNQQVTSAYDNNGNEVLSTDEVGRKTSYQYDYLDRLKATILVKSSESDPESIKVSYEHDAQGNIKTRTEPRGNQTTFEYNKVNQVIKETDPLNKFIRYDYDENGNLLKVEKGKGSGTTETVVVKEEFKYDRKNRIIENSVGGNTLYTYGYDRADNQTTIKVATDSLPYAFAYDENKRLIAAEEPGGYKLTNGYENNTSSPNHGQRKSLSETINGVQETTTYQYDILKRLTKIEGPQKRTTEFFYDESNQPIRIKNGSLNSYYDYDEEGNLKRQSSLGNKPLTLVHSYFADGDLKDIEVNGKAQSYTYDFAERLESWKHDGTTTYYSYDKSGNLLNPNEKSLTFNGANEVEGYTYDESGNLLRDSKYQYEWNQEGNLKNVKDLTGSVISSYTYHPDGLRKSKTVSNMTYHYHYDDTELVRITDDQKKTIWSFTWVNGKPVSLTNKNGNTFYYVTNYHGDVLQIVDGNGVEVASYSYDPWGNVLSKNENSELDQQPLGYAGYYMDKETSLYYLQARYYDPETARFISRDQDPGDGDDPITQNGYTYADSNPIMLVDPDGNRAKHPYDLVKVYIFVYTGSKYVRTAIYIYAKNATKKYIGKISKKLALEYKEKYKKKKKDKKKNGTPGNNQAQNKQFKAVVNKYKLSKSKARELHDAITKRNYSYKEIDEIAKEIKRGTW
ncbi:DNRLRE domain-containing protein [Bacillus idriensis]|uniref:DNRLRE domain-containing protein n=1 Tax=Metabacillus idriensis TaxID=324768 RepID=A0A6I2MGJ3_9BACI|nr:DNRLRE domain-containing protein [Metabacillus idriensis]MRX56156.1 DNRLRE domain-containing protein [Metabacillus idriensis]